MVGGAFEDLGLAGAADPVAAGGGDGDAGVLQGVERGGAGGDLNGAAGAGADEVEAGVLAVAGCGGGCGEAFGTGVGAAFLDGGEEGFGAAAVDLGAGCEAVEQGVQVGVALFVLGMNSTPPPGCPASAVSSAVKAMEARVRPPWTSRQGVRVRAASRAMARSGVMPMPPATKR